MRVFGQALGMLFALGASLTAAPPDCDGSLTGRGLTIRNIHVESRLGTLSAITLPAKQGDLLNSDLQSKLLSAVNSKIREEQFADIANRGGIQVIFTQPCLVAVGSKEVDITITPWAIRVPLPGGSESPVNRPRSASPTLRSQVPPLLRSTTPRFGLSYDRALDTTANMALSSSLGELRNSFSHLADTARHSDVLADLALSRSMKSSNYSAAANLGYVRKLGSRTRTLSVNSNLLAARQPRANASQLTNAMRNSVALRTGGVGKYWRGFGVSAAHRWAGNRSAGTTDSEQAAELRGIADLRIPAGTARTAVIADIARPDRAAAYSRLAVRSGLTTEIPLFHARDKDDGSVLPAAYTLGLEAQVTAGVSSGNLPDYARFYGGSNGGKYVFDDAIDSQLRDAWLPGPMLRGYGPSQAAIRNSGGSRYWGANLNLALPIPRWSRFLIPPDKIDDQTLGEFIEVTGLSSGENLMSSYYEFEEHLDPAVAAAKAKADIDSVRPAVRYISRYAQMPAVRPFVMLDAAQLSAAGTSRWLYSVGGGLQLTLVTARFELGYAWALTRKTGEAPGNVIFRITFQNLF